uniref:Integrator complex subunit 5 N-terminal domain-containing protein n=1 Tax=Romanomermis culicivorax TaxID=13658 RepID=A0A915KQA6_ROMCU
MDEGRSLKVNDVQQHLKMFLVVATGYTSPSKTPKVPNWSSMTLKELTESPIFLLKTVPVCKSAVFDYFRIIVIESAHMYLCQLENPSSAADPYVLEDAIVEMSTTLKILVSANPGNWLSLIFQWTLESLAEMSKRFHSRRCLNNKTLSELLKIYTANRATNSILELLNLCAGHLLTNSPEKCVAALLEVAARYGVFCDWILTFISIAYPLKIINQLVICGLNDFISHTNDLSKNMPLNQAVQRCEQYNREKLSSLASILSHLAVQQTTELRHCFVALIEQALSSDFVKKRQDVFAFLLKLCVFSRNIVDVLMKDLPKYSSTENLIQIVSALSVMPPHVLFSDQSLVEIDMIFAVLQQFMKDDKFVADFSGLLAD